MKRFTAHAFLLLVSTQICPIYVVNHNMTYFADRYENEKIEEARYIIKQQYEQHVALMKAEEEARLNGQKEQQKKIAEEIENFEKVHGLLDQKTVEHVLSHAPEDIKQYLARLEYLKSIGDQKNFNQCLKAVMLLEGSPGVGKSDLAKAIGQKLGRPVFVVEASFLANSYKDSAAENLRTSIENALKKEKEVVIILEELQVIVDKRKDGMRVDTDAAATLWRLMDKYKENKNVLFIVTTNSSTHFNDALISRLKARTFTVPEPTEEARKQAFNYLINKMNGSPLFNEACLQKLAYNSTNYTYREIYDLVEKIYDYAIDSKKNQLRFEDVKHLMKIHHFYDKYFPPSFRGCHYNFNEKTYTEMIACTLYEMAPLFLRLYEIQQNKAIQQQFLSNNKNIKPQA